jgi:hypothetical protein
MTIQFETEQFEFVNSAKIHITNHQFGHNRQGEMDVWIERGAKGERFLSQLQVQGELYAIRKEIYSKKCYILCEKSTGIYWFLDKNDCGFWLQTASFNGAKTFRGDESTKIDEWLLTAAKAA